MEHVKTCSKFAHHSIERVVRFGNSSSIHWLLFHKYFRSSTHSNFTCVRFGIGTSVFDSLEPLPSTATTSNTSSSLSHPFPIVIC
ncbi:hypothetical protein HanXRQr2_Chr15g0691141 [Helianthus annuus]|uniref:Uncharacterized protein n=1 Tax=Helianthus annuus TaxID=4232 RepID=A0A9K3DZW4_HELAN|nr:hypothetical protein HanXRQr2_Chr15g0691141 [Helianthus annuus]KAJ0831093.1 hypothetical protein HanPSC8_Chr15g0663011 [Helianthus annuus]